MKRVKNFWLLIQAVACFVWAVVKGFAGDFRWALGKIRNIDISAGVKRMPDSSLGFFRGVRCAVRAVFDFLTGERSAKFINKIRRDFEQGVRRSRGGVPLHSIDGRRIPGDHNRWQMLKRQLYGGAFVALNLGYVAGLGLMVILNFSWPFMIGFGLFVASILFVGWIVASIWGHQMRCFHLGLVGELKVAQDLERIISKPNWFVFHGFKPKYGGDIDHVLVCPKGVFCFEVKSHSQRNEGEKVLYYRIKAGDKFGKIFDKYGRNPFPYSDPLEQAMDNARRLHGRLQKEIGKNPKFVRRIVCFPGWKVEREGEHQDRNEFVSGDQAEIEEFIDSFSDKLDETLSQEIREFLERESAEEWEEIPL